MYKLKYSILLVLALSMILIFQVKQTSNTGKKAAIIDGLYLDYPNDELISHIKRSLELSEYSVDVYKGRQVTVSLYEKLPQMGYDLLIIRVHSAPAPSGGGTVLFTGEASNDTAYLFERVGGLVVRAKTLQGSKSYFAVTPKFWMEKAKGDFKGAKILLLSCYGFLDDILPKIFLMKGASYYIGWEEKVSVKWVDKAAELLVDMLTKGISVEEAVKRVNEELGPDPSTNSYLRYAKRP